MRLLSVSLLLALCGATIANTLEKRTEGEASDSDTVKPTVFNGVEVPPMIQIVGQDFNTTVKEGWWLVKHHSYVTELRPKSILLTTFQPLVRPLQTHCPSIPNSLRILLHFHTYFHRNHSTHFEGYIHHTLQFSFWRVRLRGFRGCLL
jgi:hypothetical protein